MSGFYQPRPSQEGCGKRNTAKSLSQHVRVLEPYLVKLATMQGNGSWQQGEKLFEAEVPLEFWGGEDVVSRRLS